MNEFELQRLYEIQLTAQTEDERTPFTTGTPPRPCCTHPDACWAQGCPRGTNTDPGPRARRARVRICGDRGLRAVRPRPAQQSPPESPPLGSSEAAAPQM